MESTKERARRRSADQPATPNFKPAPRVTEETRQQMIAEVAYYRAERRGFTDGDPTTDWLAAEKEIDLVLSLRR